MIIWKTWKYQGVSKQFLFCLLFYRNTKKTQADQGIFVSLSEKKSLINLQL